MIRKFLPILLLASISLDAIQETSSAKLKTLYNSLDPKSISQHLAFYELYSQSNEGQQALKDAYKLLCGTPSPSHLTFTRSIPAIVSLINKNPNDSIIELSDEALGVIDLLASRLPNRQKMGYRAISEEQVLQLPADQVDLARGLLLSQLGYDADNWRKVRSYEAALDLMALQILTSVSLQAPAAEKIRAMNRFIFEEMGFRFPPHSIYAKEIDLYTFLPSVIDSRRGVCLGVSILYLCLAQRLNLDLEIVIPPGHIFVRYGQGDGLINIETTARGIHLPNEEYLGVDTRSLPQCNIKQTIGMAHFNQASVYWKQGQYEKALASYVKARPYLPDYELLTQLMGYVTILTGQEEEGRKMLEKIVQHVPEHVVSKDTLPEDYLNGRVGHEGIKAIFMEVNESRESLLEKKQVLEDVVAIYPFFREGLFILAGTWLQLHRANEALQILERYHFLDPRNASVEYYLSAIYAERMDYNKAWEHLRLAEKLTAERDHHPKALKELRQELVKICPE